MNPLRETIKRILKEKEFPRERIAKLGDEAPVTGDEKARDIAYAKATVQNIKDKFREMGIDTGDVDIMPYESMKKPFDIKFKINRKKSGAALSSIFGDRDTFTGKAMINEKLTKKEKTLVLVLKSKGEEINMYFAEGSTDDMVPSSRLEVKGIREGGTYGGTFSKGGISGDDKVRGGYYEYETNKGKKLVVSPIEDQSDVKPGWVIVKNVKTNRRFGAEKSRLKPERKIFQFEITITDLGWKSVGSNEVTKEKGTIGYEPVSLSKGGNIKLNRDSEEKMSEWFNVEGIKNDLKKGNVTIRRSEKDKRAFIMAFPNKTVAVIKPKDWSEKLNYLDGWDNVPVEIGRMSRGKPDFSGIEAIVSF